jgi:proteic killer suppression protein
MIKSFRCRDTERLFNGRFSRKLPQNIQRVAARKLEMLAAATIVDSLRIPPANRLEALKGDRAGQHSIRINDQWRICFRWHKGDAFDVEIESGDTIPIDAILQLWRDWQEEKSRVSSRSGTPHTLGRSLCSLFAAWFVG